MPLHWSIAILLCAIFGANLAAIGFNIMHDAGHNSFSDNKRLNTVLSYSLNLLGGNIYFWKLKHNIAHHTYTNIDGEDHDIEVKFMRIHHDQKLKNITATSAFTFRCYTVSPISPGFLSGLRKILPRPYGQ
ncbi:fatty acid desaturase [Sphingobacterium sp. E70]|uniref:fatty acid desaturase n=1 Tax=Sphingobacterium sp. E70 TaxID=2853439 RepID=UPI00211CFD96|nr:fatty acid desaturase [Sphingobacterium sp. E70]